MWRGFKKGIKITCNPITKRPDDFVLSFSLYPPLLSLVLYAYTHMHVCTPTHTHTHTQALCIKVVVQFYRLLSMNGMSGAFFASLNVYHNFPSPRLLSEYMEPYLLRKVPPPYLIPPLWLCMSLRALFSDALNISIHGVRGASARSI